MKVLHIISGLKSGGAEGVLYRLILGDKNNEHFVISLTNEGFYGHLLKKNNIYIHCLNLKKNLSLIFYFFKLVFLIKKINPNIVQCWMYHGDVFGGLAAKVIGKKKIFWNLRNSDLNIQWSNKFTIFLAKFSSFLSYLIPYKIISCSNKSTVTHNHIGYCGKKILLIDNGFDKAKFRYSLNLAKYWRSKIKIKSQSIVFGFAARWSDQKDFGTLFKAFSFFKKKTRKSYSLKLLLIGENINKKNKELQKEISKYGLYNHIILLDESNSINEILNVIDIGIFASKGNEGFPNVIAEKMLTRIPCIVADVGDSRRIIGKNGYLYKKRSWVDLNKKIDLAYNNFILNKSNWIAKKNFSRKRIVNFFSLKRMINKYNRVWIK